MKCSSVNCHQYWCVNHDQTIQNKTNKQVLDIYEGVLRPGNKIIVYPKHGGKNQRFIIQPVT